MKMNKSSFRSCMKHLFNNCVTILRRNSLSWVIKDHSKLSVQYLPVVKPSSSRQRLETVFNLRTLRCRLKWRGSRSTLWLWQKPFRPSKTDRLPSRLARNHALPQRLAQKNLAPIRRQRTRNYLRALFATPAKDLPQQQTTLCSHPPCQSTTELHLIDDWPLVNAEEKENLKMNLWEEVAARKAANSPAWNTGTQHTKEKNPQMAESLVHSRR